MSESKFVIKVFVSILLLLLGLVGCSSAPVLKSSGFLGDYSGLVESAEYEDTFVYLADDFNAQELFQLDKIRLMPFELWLVEEDVTNINSGLLIRISNYFNQTLEEALADDYQLVGAQDEVDDNTFTIRGAFSRVLVGNPNMSVRDFIPIRLVLNSGNQLYLSATNQQELISEVSIEVEFIQGGSNERIFAMTASKSLDTTVMDSSEGNVEAVTQLLDIWINNFITILREAKTSAP